MRPKQGRKRKIAEVGSSSMTGPKSLFRGKVRRPLSVLLTPTGYAVEERVRARTGLSRGDLYEFLLTRYGPHIDMEDLVRSATA